MGIIYISSLWTGIKPFFTKGSPKNSGMPAFYEVFIRLLNNEKVDKIYIIFVSENSNFQIPEEYTHKIEVFHIPSSSGVRLLVNTINALIIIRKIVRKTNISCIYGCGPIAGIAGIAGILFNVKCVRRLYGTFLINKLSDSKFKLFIDQPYEYLSFSLKANRIFITNDGTHGDEVYKKIGNKKLGLDFLINGIDKNPQFEDISNMKFLNHSKYVTYIARFDPWKRQHLFVEIINMAALKELRIPAYIIGQVCDFEYYNEVVALIKKYKLEDIITIIPGLPKNQINTILHGSVCSFSLYNTSNLGNVFLEGLSLGVPMIGFNVNDSLKYLDSNCFVSVDDGDVVSASEKLEELWTNAEKRDELSQKAYQYANLNLLSWEERANIEIDAILN